MEEYRHDLEVCKGFLDKTQKAVTTGGKKDKLDYIKIENFLFKVTIRKWIDKLWHLFDKELISKVCKEPLGFKAWD